MAIFYKFVPPERKDFFTSFRLRFTPPSQFNDAFECFPAIELSTAEQWFDRLLDVAKSSTKVSTPSVLRPLLENALDQANNDLRQHYLDDPYNLQDLFQRHLFCVQDATFGILCLTERIDSQLMWAHYAQNHTGFAIGFDSDHEYFRNKEESKRGIPALAKVTYLSKRPLVDMNKISFDWRHALIKHVDWAYENEWRLMKQLSGSAEVVELHDTKIHLFDIPREAVNEVVFGIRVSDELRRDIDTARTAVGLQVGFRQAKLSPTDYSVVVP